MTLRVEDLKAGDVVRMDAQFERIDRDGDAEFTVAGCQVFVNPADLAAGNAELVVRPRPVRKGDEMRNSETEPRTFVALFEERVYTAEIQSVGIDYARDYWTHADGSPIDWEASE